ncbi:MAG: hypothetical protein IT371_12240 [Deltaproteobacteria bacterium]|nr:hypothetical protein [Deltaproteobacteria bacterium]
MLERKSSRGARRALSPPPPRRATRRTLALACITTLFHLPMDAQAQTRLRGLLKTTSGYEGNVDAPEAGSVVTPTTRRDEGFVEVVPRVVLRVDRPASNHLIEGEFLGRLNFLSTRYNLYSGRLLYRVNLETSRNTNLTLELAGIEEQYNLGNLLWAGTYVLFGSDRPAKAIFVTARAREAFDWQITPHWYFSQWFTIRALVPAYVDGDTWPSRLQLDGNAEVYRQFRDDQLGAVLSTTYAHSLGYTGFDGSAVPQSEQVLAAGSAAWRHAFSRAWDLRLAAGALFALRGDSSSWWVVQPTGQVLVRFQGREVREHLSLRAGFELGYDHDASPNLLRGDTLIGDRVHLKGALPLDPGHRVLVSVEGSYLYGQRISATLSRLDRAAHLVLADGALQWRLSDHVELELRYQFGAQRHASATAPVPDLTRHLVVAGVTVVYPSEYPRRPGW